MRAVIIDVISTLIDHNLKINAIKTLRQASRGTLGLKEAKDLVELTWGRNAAIDNALRNAGWPEDFDIAIKSKPNAEDRHRDMMDYARQEGSMTFAEMAAYNAGHKDGSR